MIEILVAVLSAVGGLFLFRFLSKSSADKGQIELEIKTAVLEEKANNILAGIKKNDQATKDSVDDITREQNTEVSGSSLADWFNKRKR